MAADQEGEARRPRSRDAKGDARPSKKPRAPLYLQVASTLRTTIVRGVFPVGSRIPTEEELCDQFKVSRHTVREALRKLRDDGLITSRQGGRPIVVPPSALASVRRFYSETDKNFYDYSMGTRVIIQSMEMVPITKALAAQLEIDQGGEWLRVNGYRQSDEKARPICWCEYYIIAEFAAVARLLPGHIGPVIPLVEALFSERIVKLTQSLSAVPMPAEHAAKLNVAAGSPALKIVNRCETPGGRLVMIVNSLHPSGDVAYSISLHEDSAKA